MIYGTLLKVSVYDSAGNTRLSFMRSIMIKSLVFVVNIVDSKYEYIDVWFLVIVFFFFGLYTFVLS